VEVIDKNHAVLPGELTIKEIIKFVSLNVESMEFRKVHRVPQALILVEALQIRDR
jgi:hypothetical protein